MKCKQCPTDFKQYSTLETLCPKCKVDKLKKDENESISRRKVPKIKSPDLAVINRSINDSRARNRKVVEGGNRRAKAGKDYAIPNLTAKKKEAKRLIAQNKKKRIGLLGSVCEGCGHHGPVDWSHIVPISLDGALETVYDNGSLHCSERTGAPGCHEKYEHLKPGFEKLLNLPQIIVYLEKVNTKRYWRIIDKLKTA